MISFGRLCDRSVMIIVVVLSFVWVFNVNGMEQSDKATELARECNALIRMVEHDYGIFEPYVIRLVQHSVNEDYTPINILEYLTSTEAEINKLCVCEYKQPSQYLADILKKQKLKMIVLYNEQLKECNQDYKKATAWFVDYFKKAVVHKALYEIKTGIIKSKLPELNAFTNS